MLSIRNNLLSDTAARYVSQNYESLARSVVRLSSGLRIVGASDDAAGMAVRELMRSDIVAMHQATRNTQDAVSMLQTAEGALQAVDNILVRMKELASQASTGTYNGAQRGIINDEFQQMAAEVDRIAGSTAFNGITMLNSAHGTLTVQVGQSGRGVDQITVAMADTSTAGLKLAGVAVDTQTKAAAALARLDSAIALKDGTRAQFGYKMNRLQTAVNVLSIQAENLQAAESSISDVNMAQEMATLTRDQVLAKTGTAILAQANTLPQLALRLLAG
jgi:flagellin